MSKSYSELLRDPRWQRKRLKVLEREDFTCEKCRSKENTLNVHHKKYRKGAKPWEYEDHELEVACDQCHEQIHRFRSLIEQSISSMDVDRLSLVAGYALAAATGWGKGEVIRVIDAEHASGIGDFYGIGYKGVMDLMRGESLHVDDVVEARRL